MMTLKQINDMSEDEKKKFVNTVGIITLCLAEGKGLWDMADELKMEAYYVDHDIDEILYVLRKGVGLRRFIKSIFLK